MTQTKREEKSRFVSTTSEAFHCCRRLMWKLFGDLLDFPFEIAKAFYAVIVTEDKHERKIRESRHELR